MRPVVAFLVRGIDNRDSPLPASTLMEWRRPRNHSKLNAQASETPNRPIAAFLTRGIDLLEVRLLVRRACTVIEKVELVKGEKWLLMFA